MAPRRFFPDKVLTYAEKTAGTEELPVLLVHLDAYISGIREAREVGRIVAGRATDVDVLIQDAHEVQRQIQAMLRDRGWRLLGDAKTWVAP